MADSFQTRFWKGCGSVLVHCWWLESLIFYFYAAKTVPYSLSKARCLTSTETIRLIRDGEKGEGVMEVGVEGDYSTNRYTVTTRMTPALRWAAMRAILMFHKCEGQSHKTVSTDHNL